MCLTKRLAIKCNTWVASAFGTISPLTVLSNYLRSSFICIKALKPLRVKSLKTFIKSFEAPPSSVNPANLPDDLLNTRPDLIFMPLKNKLKYFSQAFSCSKLLLSRNILMISGLNRVSIVVNSVYPFNVVWCGRLRNPLWWFCSYASKTKREK